MRRLFLIRQRNSKLLLLPRFSSAEVVLENRVRRAKTTQAHMHTPQKEKEKNKPWCHVNASWVNAKAQRTGNLSRQLALKGSHIPETKDYQHHKH